MHYARIGKSGAAGPIDGLFPVYVDDLARFMAKTRRDPSSGCLIWTAYRNKHGYGRFYWRGRRCSAHRWIFERMYGYLPDAVMHRCDTPACVDWESCLTPGTQAMNLADMAAKGKRKGERSAQAVLTDAAVLDIRASYAEGLVTQQMLADLYGVTPSQVSNVVTRKSWSHVP